MVVAAPKGTFDFVTIQLYETWSRADQALIALGLSGSDYLMCWPKAVVAVWVVDFRTGFGLTSRDAIRFNFPHRSSLWGSLMVVVGQRLFGRRTLGLHTRR